jgi:hypothetical protein
MQSAADASSAAVMHRKASGSGLSGCIEEQHISATPWGVPPPSYKYPSQAKWRNPICLANLLRMLRGNRTHTALSPRL